MFIYPLNYKFFDKKSTLSGFMVALNGETTFPAVLNNLSDAELEAQMHKYFCASIASTQKCDCWLFHHTKGFSSKSSQCPDRYPSISFVTICLWCSSTLTGKARLPLVL